MWLLWLGWMNIIAQTDEPCVAIASVRIEARDVFEDSDDIQFYHRWFQGIHRTTRQRVIQRELLFVSGDCLQLDLIHETERNLRAMSILSDANIEIEWSIDKQSVHLVVKTQDRFTARLEMSYSRKGGLNRLRYSAGEKNLLGLGIDVHYSNSSRSDGSDVERVVLASPRVFDLFLLKGSYSHTDEGTFRELSVKKPFWDLNDRDAFSLTYWGDHTKADYYEDGGESTEIPIVDDLVKGVWSRELGEPQFSKRTELEIGFQQTAYQPVPGIDIPPATDNQFLGFTFAWNRRKRFLEVTGVDSLRKVEDIAEHHRVAIGFENNWRTRDETKEVHQTWRFEMAHVALPRDWLLIGTGISAKSRTFMSDQKSLNTSMYVHNYVFLPKRQSFVVGVAYDYSYTLDDLYLPIFLGEDTGLRGYPAFSITGNKRLLINVEHRWIFPWQTQNTTWGQVVFFDSGSAWKPGEAMKLSKMHSSVGWGVRLDMPSMFGSKIFRVDFAHGFEGESLSISASVGHIFKHNQVNRGFDRDY